MIRFASAVHLSSAALTGTGSVTNAWHYRDRGAGRPLILLHGIGMSHVVWHPVLPYLCDTRRVIAFDTAGFGATPALPRNIPPTIVHLVDALEHSLRAIGLEPPVDIAGNSLGGSMALEAARRGLARTVVAIAPPGLWRRRGAPHVKYVFGALRLATTRAPRLVSALMARRWLREAALAVPVSLGSRRMRAADAVRAAADIGAAAAFEATFDYTRAPFVCTDITVPVTVAFGDRDWILTKGSQRREHLPPHARWLRMRGWGHVPMWIDPAGVARLILDGTR